MKRSALLFAILLCWSAAVGQDRPARPKILGIVSVQLYTSSVDAARDFYSRVLGPKGPCVSCEEVPSSNRLIPLPLNAEQFVLVASEPQTHVSRLGEIIFEVGDLEAMKRFLTDDKVEFSIPKGADEGIELRDPESRRIRFIHHWSSSPKSALNASRLHLIHAGFIVHDRAATEHFYKDILGFRPYWHGGMKDDQTDWVSMQVPDGTDWLEFMVNVDANPDQRLRGIMNHIAIGVTDIHETEKRLRAAGAPVNEEPKIGRDGKWQLNLYDPDQTRIEFMEFKPVQRPCCSDFTGPHPQP